MNVEVKQSQLCKAVKLWMDNNYGPDKLQKYIIPKYSDYIFYKKNGQTVMELDKASKIFSFHYNEIWSFLKSFFSLNDFEIEDCLRYWLKETFKMEGYEPFMVYNFIT